MLIIKENINIKNYTTLKIGGISRYFSFINKKDDIQEAYKFAEEKKIKVFILGGGSNVIFPNGVINVLVLKINISGFEIINETNEYVDLKIGAGENWDKIVSRTIKMNLSGFELLSLIPGTVGATPVQNVGAYGAEVENTILKVEVFDTKENKIILLSNKDCQFDYRNSIFKKEGKGRYLIITVVYRLLKSLPEIPIYPGFKKYFIENQINNPGLKEIREAVIYIRNEKLPNVEEDPNVGSFFKNPIIDKDIAKELKNMHKNLPTFPVDDNLFKVPAGWLIENAGLKGKSFGKISIYKNNALVLINKGGATKEDLMLAKNEIVKVIKEKFNIILEQEPEMV